MKIRNVKLPKDAVENLRRIPVEICKPFDVLMTPVYVYLPKNGKFVAVKTPLQYFSPQEIEKFKPYENFYLPEFVDLLAPFQKAGEAVRTLLQVAQKRPVKTSSGTEMAPIPMPQHELDDAVLHLIGPLWNDSARIEPFFLCFLANEVCLPFSAEVLADAIETSTELFELALLRASTAVFLALHVGYADARTLTLLREKLFWDTMNGQRATESATELSLLQNLIWEVIPNSDVREISMDGIREALWRTGTGGKVSRKLLSRLERVLNQFVRPHTVVASLYGEKGIRDD